MSARPTDPSNMTPRDPDHDTLDARAIARALGASAKAIDVEVVDACTSTNALLLDRAAGDRPRLLAAEFQSTGRGRRGRRWHSAPGAGLTFSLARRIRRPVSALSGLSLAAGVAVGRTLRELGANAVELKWPNDLVAQGAKLGGILVETKPSGGAVLAVVGIGINCRRVPELDARLRRQTIALEQLVPSMPSRSRLAGRIAAAMLRAIESFETDGLDRLREDWEAMHAYAGQRIRVRLADGHLLSGIAAGLACDGALRLRTRSGIREVHSATVVNARAGIAPRNRVAA